MEMIDVVTMLWLDRFAVNWRIYVGKFTSQSSYGEASPEKKFAILIHTFLASYDVNTGKQFLVTLPY